MIRRLGYIEANKTLQVIRDITQEEESEILGFVNVLGQYYNDLLLLKMVQRNYNNLMELISRYESESNIDRSISFIRDNERVIELNTSVLNFLTVFRTFLDHHETKFKKKFGKKSIESQELKKLQSKEFDSSLAYRFFYKYRNYCQHCGVPISKLASQLVKDEIGNELVDFKIELEKEMLLDGHFDWGMIVKKDIESYKKDIDLKQLLIAFDGTIERIHKGIVLIKKQEILSAIKGFLSYTYHPEIGLKTIVSVKAKNLKEYKSGNFKIHPIVFSNMEDVAQDLIKLGIYNITVESKGIMPDILR